MTSLPPPPPPKTAPPAATPKPAGLTFRRAADTTPRYHAVLNAVAGWGKTTVMAYAPNPVILTAPMESGIDTLRAAGRVPDVPSHPVTSFAELIRVVRSSDVKPFKTLCIDALGGIVAMLQQEVKASDFENSEAKFASWGRGSQVVSSRFLTFLTALNDFPGNVIIGSHSEVGSFNNPNGDNYSRYESDSHKDVWAAVTRWADAVLFGTYFTIAKDGKATGGKHRIVHTEQDAAHDAKNRHGLPAIIEVPSDPAQAYAAIFGPIESALRTPHANAKDTSK